MSSESESDCREISLEAEGATLGEAKWTAVKTLQESYPGLSGEYVQFEPLAEAGADGPAKVRAVLDLEHWQSTKNKLELPLDPVERIRALAEWIISAVGLRASLSIEEDEEGVAVYINGSDLALLIGKHGRTVEAVQLLLTQAGFKGSSQWRRVTVDVGGYRKRRRIAVQNQAEKAAKEALRFSRAVELDPMNASDRRTVHTYLQERDSVETHSEGSGYERRVVVSPLERRAD